MAINYILNYIRSWIPQDFAPRKRKSSEEFIFRSNKSRRLNSSYAEYNVRYPLMEGRRHTRLKSVFDDDDDDIKIVIPPIQQRLGAIPKRPSLSSRRSDGDLVIIGDVNSARNKSTTMPKNTSLEFSFCRDSRRDYENLLNSHCTLQKANLYRSKFDSPISSRSKRLIQLSQAVSSKKNRVETVDLTAEDEIVINDSDSDDVEVVSTQSKSDTTVKPVNSLKTEIDTVKTTKQQWLKDITTEHERYLDEQKKEIQAYTDNSYHLNNINRDLLINSLARRVNDSLAIKESILPVIELDDEEDDFKETKLPKLTKDQLTLVEKALSRGNSNQVLTKKFNLNLTKYDLSTLSGLEWLNDNVINFYMNLIIERSEQNNRLPKSYTMNTFFYPKLIQSGPASLRRWTRKVDIFAYRYICVPIHLDIHWCMAIIDLKLQTIKYYDSMSHANNRCLNALREYLEYEHQDKKGEPFSTEHFKLENVANIPQQMNGSDCGMFACTFAEYVTRNAALTFSQKDMPYFRKKCMVEILLGHLLIND